MRYSPASLVLLLVFPTACTAPQVPGTRTGRPELLTRAEAAVARDDWDDAAVLLGRFLRENPNDAYALQARFLLGTYYLNEHELASADREFEYVASHARPSPLARQAEIRRGDVAVAEGDYPEAAGIYTQLLEDARRHGDEAELTFKLASVRQREGRWAESDATFNRVREKYPASVYAMRAAEQMALPHHFSLQVGAFREKPNAEKKRDELAARGLEASVHELQRQGRSLYCVRVGDFPTRAEAESYRSVVSGTSLDLRDSDVVP